MSDKDAKAMYDMFLATDELKTFMKKATGNWDKDKDTFKKIFKRTQDLLGE